MSGIEYLKCRHGNVVACKKCDEEFYEVMRQYGELLAQKQLQRIIDILLNNKRL